MGKDHIVYLTFLDALEPRESALQQLQPSFSLERKLRFEIFADATDAPSADVSDAPDTLPCAPDIPSKSNNTSNIHTSKKVALLNFSKGWAMFTLPNDAMFSNS